IDLAFEEAKRLDAMIDTWHDDSELSRVNAGAQTVSGELGAILSSTISWAQKTSGRTRGLNAESETTDTEPRGGRAMPVRGSIRCVKVLSPTVKLFSEPELVEIERLPSDRPTAGASRFSGFAIVTNGWSPYCPVFPPELMRTPFVPFCLKTPSMRSMARPLPQPPSWN